jgi:hypothetical protein
MLAQGGGSKFFNEHLGPLRRYLAKQVGRPWNKVYSEICENLRVDSVVQAHVRDHVAEYVETCVIEIDGVACRGTYPVGAPLTRGYRLFYVCPRSGILRAINRPKRRVVVAPVDAIRIDDTREYRRMDGIWYEVFLAPITAAAAGRRDIVLGTEVGHLSKSQAAETYGSAVFATRRRQLNKREIRKVTGARS